MDLNKIKKQWHNYNDEFENSDFIDVDTHTSMALKVGELIREIERLQSINVVATHLMTDKQLKRLSELV